MSSIESERLIAAAERLHDTADGLRAWARGYLPGQLPSALQRIIDAADDYAARLDDFQSEQTDNPSQPKGEIAFPSVSKQTQQQ